MEELRAQAISKLGVLNNIKKQTYSARDLHLKKAMLSRVQRQEQKRYEREVNLQKLKLKKDIENIDQYLKSVNDNNLYLANLPEQKTLPEQLHTLDTESLILPIPNVVFGKKPILRRARLQRYKRRSKY